MDEIKNKKMYLEYLRVISMAAVVLIHVFVTARTDFPMHSENEEILTGIIRQIFHFAVPIFFMITGALFLQSKKKIDIKTLYKKYILKYALIIIIFGWVYALIEEIFKGNISFMAILNSFINMLSGKTWDHLWYLYELLGIMLVLPILKLMVDFSDEKNNILDYFLILLIIFSFAIPNIQGFINFDFGVNIPIRSEYLAYIILGYLIDKKEKRKKENIICIATILISFVIIIISNIIKVKFNIPIMDTIGNYNSLIIMIMSISIFALIKNITKNKTLKLDKIILTISKYSFGVYIIHMFWINIIYKFLKFNIYGNLLILKVFGTWVIVVILSILSTMILKHIPLIKKIV